MRVLAHRVLPIAVTLLLLLALGLPPPARCRP